MGFQTNTQPVGLQTDKNIFKHTMKKTLVLTVALVIATASVSYAQKFGYCNSLALVAEMPEMKAADANLQTFQTQMQKKGQEMVKALQEKAAELQRKQEQGLIAPKDAAEQEEKLKKEEEEINVFAQKMESDIAKKREELYKPILEKVNEALKAVSKEGNYLMVFDTGSQILLYADESMDVTNQVKTKLGLPITAPAAGGK
jgi:outer membrane protein